MEPEDAMEPEDVLDHCLFQIDALREQCSDALVEPLAIQVGRQQVHLLAGHLYRLCEMPKGNFESLVVAPNATTALYEAAIRRGDCRLYDLPIRAVPMQDWLQVLV